MTRQSTPPIYVKPRLKGPPRMRQMFWCDFPMDARLPELWKRRPVIILSKNASLYGTATVVPVSTQDQGHSPFAFKLDSTFDAKPAWAICDKITTVAVSRLVPNKTGNVRLPPEEFDGMLRVVLGLLPQLPQPGVSDDEPEEAFRYPSP